VIGRVSSVPKQPGTYYLVGTQGGLSYNHMYRLIQTGRAPSTVTGLWYEDQWVTGSWMQ
jgi:hypothetical protein